MFVIAQKVLTPCSKLSQVHYTSVQPCLAMPTTLDPADYFNFQTEISALNLREQFPAKAVSSSSFFDFG